MALHIIGEHVDHTSPIEEFPLEQVSHTVRAVIQMVTGRCPARSQRSAAVNRLRSNSTPARTDLREESSRTTRSAIIPAPTVRFVTGSIRMNAPVPRFSVRIEEDGAMGFNRDNADLV